MLTRDDVYTHAWLRLTGAADATDLTSGVPLRIMALVITEETAGTLEVNFHNNTANSGSDVIQLACTVEQGTASVVFGPPGVRYDVGLSVDIVGSGSPRYSVFYIPDPATGG